MIPSYKDRRPQGKEYDALSLLFNYKQILNKMKLPFWITCNAFNLDMYLSKCWGTEGKKFIPFHFTTETANPDQVIKLFFWQSQVSPLFLYQV